MVTHPRAFQPFRLWCSCTARSCRLCITCCLAPPLASLPHSKLQQLAELYLFSCPATNAAAALQPCQALRRLVLGTRHYAAPSRRMTLDGGSLDGGFGAAYEDEEASLWEAAYLDTVRTALPWVAEVAAHHSAQLA